MLAIENLKAVLCDPEGNVCIQGSDEDRKIIQDNLEILEQELCTNDCPFKIFKDA